METFDPDKAWRVYDELNDHLLEWNPGEADRYCGYAFQPRNGTVSYDGLTPAGSLSPWQPPLTSED